MAWNGTYVFVAGDVLTAAQLNTYTQDNLAETAPAKATTAGGVFVASGANAIAEVAPPSATAAASLAILNSSVGWRPGAYPLATGGYVEVTNTSAETVLTSATLPGGTLGASGAIHITWVGGTQNSTGSSRTHSVSVHIGGTSRNIYSKTFGSDTKVHYLRIEAWIINANSETSQVIDGMYWRSSGTSPGWGTADNPLYASVDTTVDTTVAVKCSMSAASPDLWVRQYYCRIDVFAGA